MANNATAVICSSSGRISGGGGGRRRRSSGCRPAAVADAGKTTATTGQRVVDLDAIHGRRLESESGSKDDDVATTIVARPATAVTAHARGGAN